MAPLPALDFERSERTKQTNLTLGVAASVTSLTTFDSDKR
jgi:hypothetical protein